MKILITNDDGYQAKGIHALAHIMKRFGEVTVVAPKTHHSGMSMAISLGLRPLGFRDLGIIDGTQWYYLDGTPASCAKFAIDEVFKDGLPDVILSGINHGSNASTAMWYSGTIGAAREGALGGVPSIAVSLNNLHEDADFSVVEQLFPAIFEKLMANLPKDKILVYNVNFPDLPADQIRGVRSTTQGREKWVNEFVPVAPSDRQEGEAYYVMAGDVVPLDDNPENSDNWAEDNGYISITPQSLDNTDMDEYRRLLEIF
ncbi:MAG: 5'/3'-nucleotidase SurE [Bacteroidales bacterium]|nr:5'/3'-nucleotidase SurE [Bacteroidales bacterium]MCR4910689.1 5'/3'-nucleotidase SurE [Bacteroidales bacterium]